MTSAGALYEFDDDMGTRAPLCPVCLQLPKGEVYQCKDGHVACRNCYFKERKCTGKDCRRALDFDHPIRNRVFEEMAARVVKLDCPFKSNGCGEKVPASRSCLQEHRNKCCYNLDKYGEMIAICKLLGHPCDFKANNGNAEVLVDHFVSDHGYIFKKGDKFRMKLTGFDEDVDLKSQERQSWTPIILELPEKQCYLLNVTLLNKDGSLSWFSVFLPFNNFTGMERSLRMEYKFSTGRLDLLEENYFKWNMGQDVINLSDMNKVLTREMSGMFQKSWLKSHFVRDGALLVDCIVIEKLAKTPKADGTAIKKFTCGFFGEPAKLDTSADGACPPSIASAPIPAPHGAHVPNEAVTSKANPIKKNPGVSCLDTYPKSHQIVVGNLPNPFIQENHLKKLLSEFGDVAEVMFVNSPGRHVAFVVFEEEKGAKLALECKKNIYVESEFKGMKVMKRLLLFEPKRL